MHGRVAAGKLTDIAFDDEGKRIVVAAKIVDDDEWQKVLEGVYTGFSQGGRYVARWDDPDTGLTRYTAEPNEISLVDLPCLPEATFEIVKNGVSERRAFAARGGRTERRASARRAAARRSPWRGRRGRARQRRDAAAGRGPLPLGRARQGGLGAGARRRTSSSAPRRRTRRCASRSARWRRKSRRSLARVARARSAAAAREGGAARAAEERRRRQRARRRRRRGDQAPRRAARRKRARWR